MYPYIRAIAQPRTSPFLSLPLQLFPHLFIREFLKISYIHLLLSLVREIFVRNIILFYRSINLQVKSRVKIIRVS